MVANPEMVDDDPMPMPTECHLAETVPSSMRPHTIVAPMAVATIKHGDKFAEHRDEPVYRGGWRKPGRYLIPAAVKVYGAPSIESIKH